MQTVYVPMIVNLGARAFTGPIPILTPAGQSHQPLSSIPSLLGRDILAHFGLFYEERTGRVLLLDPAEVDALGLP
jgi:hypothetical protein